MQILLYMVFGFHINTNNQYIPKPYSLSLLFSPLSPTKSPHNILYTGLPQWLSSKDFACNAGASGDTGSIPGWRRFPGGGQGNPLQYSCLGHPMDRGAWRPTAHGVAKSRTWPKQLHMHAFRFSYKNRYLKVREAGEVLIASVTHTKRDSCSISYLV